FTIRARENLPDIAQECDLDMRGACYQAATCSTSHAILVDFGMYKYIPKLEDDENNMLDLAFGPREPSWLGCQVKMGKEIDGLVVKLLSMIRNLQLSDLSKKEMFLRVDVSIVEL
ncbi:hypothetical protein L873DRAFT_1710393, partial [Choiromyces venosus 120613-1]